VSAPAAKPHTVDPITAFRARCDARAYLVAAGEYDLHQAFDELQVDAVQSGLVAEYGQDLIQTLMTAALRPYPRAAIITEPREITAETKLTRTPRFTVEALMWSLREKGLACLSLPANRNRLSRCDAAAMTWIAQRLVGLQWDPGDIEKLILVRDEEE
jgi:hypothetical protein